MSVGASLLYGLVNLLHPRMLWLMLWPMLVALGVWGTVALVLWTRTARALAEMMAQWAQSAPLIGTLDLSHAALVAANVILFLGFVPLVYLTALFILSVFGMEKMVEHVASRSYPELERRHGGSFLGSAWNAVAALIGMALLALLSVPLWLFPPLWPVVPVAIFGWANQRLLRYDALAVHADAAETRLLFRQRRGALYFLGLLLALAAYVPVLGFVAPMVFGLAFIHYLLGALQRLRGSIAPMTTKDWPDRHAAR